MPILITWPQSKVIAVLPCLWHGVCADGNLDYLTKEVEMEVMDHYRQKLISPKEVISHIKPGNRIYMSSGTAIPTRIARELIDSPDFNNYDLEIIQLFTLGDYFNESACEGTFGQKPPSAAASRAAPSAPHSCG